MVELGELRIRYVTLLIFSQVISILVLKSEVDESTSFLIIKQTKLFIESISVQLCTTGIFK